MNPVQAAAMKRTAKHLSKRPADVNWMLALISTIDEDHVYFHKDYQKPKKVVELTEDLQSPGVIGNDDGFFDNLPISKNVGKKHKLNFAGQSKVDREK